MVGLECPSLTHTRLSTYRRTISVRAPRARDSEKDGNGTGHQPPQQLTGIKVPVRSTCVIGLAGPPDASRSALHTVL